MMKAINTNAWPLLLAVVLALILLLVELSVGTNDVESWKIASRWTARIGFPFFILMFSAPALSKLWPNDMSRSLVNLRPWFGIAFAASHSFHLFTLLNFLDALPERPPTIGLALFIWVYIPIYVMAFTSLLTIRTGSDNNWRLLRETCIYIIWTALIFVYTSKAIISADQRVISIILCAIALCAMGIRMTAWLKTKSASLKKEGCGLATAP